MHRVLRPLVRSAIRLAGAVFLAAAALAAPASAADYYGGDYSERIPACDDAKVQSTIASRFAKADREYWREIDAIEAIDAIRQSGYKVDNPSPLARRYCHARVAMSDGRTRTMYYMIEEDAGFVGKCWNVEFCIRGLDRWHIYDPTCRTVRP
ncbi:MAG: cytoplasmic protein [Hyphomicrobiales bacterium]|nr:MAG: cytoplasmic protein [Hyphomicrobiales bacterium]